MDPLSVTASLLAILGAVSVTLETISSLRSAPKELHALLEELSAIQIICCNVKDLFGSRLARDGTTSEHVHLLSRLSQRSQTKFDEINELMTSARLTSSNEKQNDSKMPKIAQLRWIKAKKRLKAIREELREIRFQFIACVGNLTR
jgi:hypothetical protein